jgi:hypothetical protein
VLKTHACQILHGRYGSQCANWQGEHGLSQLTTRCYPDSLSRVSRFHWCSVSCAGSVPAASRTQRTAACRYIDFIIGDAVVSSPDFQHGYTEKLLMMPYTFQVAHLQNMAVGHAQQRIAGHKPRRRAPPPLARLPRRSVRNSNRFLISIVTNVTSFTDTASMTSLCTGQLLECP